jgi:hypothetical protein
MNGAPGRMKVVPVTLIGVVSPGSEETSSDAAFRPAPPNRAGRVVVLMAACVEHEAVPGKGFVPA